MCRIRLSSHGSRLANCRSPIGIRCGPVGADRRRKSGVVLVGAAGVGKTTLARAVTNSLRSEVRWVASTESSKSIPLGVFAHLVGPSTSRDPTALLASARESLVAQDNTIVGVDDAHLLDQLSATLLHQIAVDQAGRILATVRSGNRSPTPSPRCGRTATSQD